MLSREEKFNDVEGEETASFSIIVITQFGWISRKIFKQNRIIIMLSSFTSGIFGRSFQMIMLMMLFRKQFKDTKRENL